MWRRVPTSRYVVVAGSPCIGDVVLAGFMGSLFNIWINGCFDGFCEYGFLSDRYSAIDVGRAFLSVAKMYFPFLRRIVVYDIDKLVKYHVGLWNISAEDVSLDRIAGPSRISVIGLKAVSDNMVEASVLPNPSKLADRVAEEILAQRPNHEAWNIRCRAAKLEYSGKGGVHRFLVLYKCAERKGYMILYRVLWLLRHRPSAVLGGRNTIAKPVWVIEKK